jgi:hypothetical protein
MTSKLIPSSTPITNVRDSFAEEQHEGRFKKGEDKKVKEDLADEGIDELENMLDDQLTDFKKESEKKDKKRLNNNQKDKKRLF